MTTYTAIAQALKTSGYLSETDLDLVIAVLVDGLAIQDTANAVAGDDELIAEAAISGACTNAANALATAGFIDSANVEITATLIINLWLTDDHEER